MRAGLLAKTSTHILWLVVSTLLLSAPAVQASTIIFDNSAAFFAAVGPTMAYKVSAVPPIPAFAGLPFRFDDGAFPNPGNNTTFELGEGPTGFNSLSIADFSPLYAGNELAVRSGVDLEAHAFGFCSDSVGGCLPNPFFFSIGFNIVATGTPFVDSLFQVTLISAASGPDTVVDSFVASVPNETAAFIGYWSNKPIRTVIISDLAADPGDSLFGDFFIGTQSNGVPEVVPEPSAIVLLTTGLVGLLRYRRRSAGVRSESGEGLP
jgi:hypothetical protein